MCWISGLCNFKTQNVIQTENGLQLVYVSGKGRVGSPLQYIYQLEKLLELHLKSLEQFFPANCLALKTFQQQGKNDNWISERDLECSQYGLQNVEKWNGLRNGKKVRFPRCRRTCLEKHVVASRLGTRLPRNCVFLKIPIVSAFKNLPQEA